MDYYAGHHSLKTLLLIQFQNWYSIVSKPFQYLDNHDVNLDKKCCNIIKKNAGVKTFLILKEYRGGANLLAFVTLKYVC